MQETSDVIDNLAFSIVWANKTKHLEFLKIRKKLSLEVRRQIEKCTVQCYDLFSDAFNNNGSREKNSQVKLTLTFQNSVHKLDTGNESCK